MPAQPAIAISTARDDSGRFEFDFHGERYLPFEGAGVDCDWRFELTAPLPLFNYDSIADLVLLIRYTAAEDENPSAATTAATHVLLKTLGYAAAGGESPVVAATDLDAESRALLEKLDAGSGPLTRMFSARREFPDAWARFTGGNGPLVLEVGAQHFPYFARGADQRAGGIRVTAASAVLLEGSSLTSLGVSAPPSTALGNNTALGAWAIARPDIDAARWKDVVLLVNYRIASL